MTHNLALLVAGFNGVAYFFSSLVPIWAIDRYDSTVLFFGIILLTILALVDVS